MSYRWLVSSTDDSSGEASKLAEKLNVVISLGAEKSAVRMLNFQASNIKCRSHPKTGDDNIQISPADNSFSRQNMWEAMVLVLFPFRIAKSSRRGGRREVEALRCNFAKSWLIRESSTVVNDNDMCKRRRSRNRCSGNVSLVPKLRLDERSYCVIIWCTKRAGCTIPHSKINQYLGSTVIREHRPQLIQLLQRTTRLPFLGRPML